MEEILEKLKNEINTIKNEQDKLEVLTENSEKLRQEEYELQQELNSIEDKESGFYKDLSEEITEKHDSFTVANNERMNKDREINQLISEKKETILNEVVAKKQYIDENRKADLGNVNLNELKAEKEKLEKEIELNDTTKEQFMQMTDSEKQAVRKAKENYLNNKHRLDEINPTIELMDLLDGKTTKERYMELSDLEKMIEKDFNRDNLDKVLENIDNEQEIARKKAEEEAEAKRKEQEEEEAKRREQEEAEAKRKEQEEAEAKRKEREEAEAKRKEQEEAEAKRKEQEEAEAKRREQEEAERKRREAEEKAKKDREIAEKSKDVKIVYNAKTNEYKVTNLKLNKEYTITAEKLQESIDVDKVQIADEYNLNELQTNNIDLKVMAVLMDYDKQFKTHKTVEYFKEVTTIGQFSKEDRINNMKELGIDITYDLKGLYDKDRNGDKKYSKEERKEILEVANNAKTKGIAKVNKGIKVKLGELWDNIKSINPKNLFKQAKEQRFLNGKTDDIVEIDKLNQKETNKTKRRESANKFASNFKEKAQKFSQEIRANLDEGYEYDALETADKKAQDRAFSSEQDKKERVDD